MAKIKPFYCIRPREDLAATIAALPYDVYSRAEAREIVAKNPESFLAIDRAETLLPEDVDIYDARVYETAAETLRKRIAAGDFIRDDRECYYIYELAMDGRTQTGIVGCMDIDDYLSGVIKKHENTRADKEEDRVRHVNACSAQTGPIFLAYRADGALSEITARYKKRVPLYNFVSEDGVGHRVFVIDGKEDIQTVTNAFAGIGQIYIADGHHRAASAVRAGVARREAAFTYSGREEFNYFLSVCFADDELMIMDYNRVVKDLNGMSAEEFLARMRELFDVESIESPEDCAGSKRLHDAPIRPAHKGEFSMYLADVWYRCRVRGDVPDDPVRGLDVSVLQEQLLAPVLGIGDPRTDKRIDFVGGIRGLEELERRCHTDCAVAFAMYPTSIQELFAVADAGLLMPPKSTWFEPKLRSGLFIHEI